ncbi:MAG: hypothetical protein EBQ96_07235 [Proteobacteria bacterium]|nr:hypothetical protein [Pseudomonadota bacterium]
MPAGQTQRPKNKGQKQKGQKTDAASTGISFKENKKQRCKAYPKPIALPTAAAGQKLKEGCDN